MNYCKSSEYSRRHRLYRDTDYSELLSFPSYGFDLRVRTQCETDIGQFVFYASWRQLLHHMMFGRGCQAYALFICWQHDISNYSLQAEIAMLRNLYTRTHYIDNKRYQGDGWSARVIHIFNFGLN